MKTSAEVLQALFENGKSPLSGPFFRWKLWKKWPEFVGPTVSSVSEPVSLRNGTLYVWVKNAAWLQQLIFAREQIRATINQKLGEETIKSVHLTLDRRSVPMDAEERARLQRTVQDLMKPVPGDDVN